eukprot:COSAG02_NODE_28402_length_590_cov_0.967413_2_plen_75_part_00
MNGVKSIPGYTVAVTVKAPPAPVFLSSLAILSHVAHDRHILTTQETHARHARRIDSGDSLNSNVTAIVFSNALF